MPKIPETDGLTDGQTDGRTDGPAGRSHAALVDRQFGDQAAAYVTSVVHATGEDLRQIETLLHGQANARVLDLGCGGGHVALTVAPHVASVVAYDLSPGMLAAVATQAAERGLTQLRTQQGQAESLRFADRSFDWVLSRFSAHHWHDLDAGLRETARVLAPGGHAVFADVIAPPAALADTFLQAIELLRDPSHARDYTQAEWDRRLRQAGLRPLTATPRRLRLDFTSWLARMRTPELHAMAIRSLLDGAPADVRAHFMVEPDHSLTVDTLVVVAERD